MDTAEISYFRDATKFFWRHAFDGRKNRRHCVVDPDVDLAQFGFDLRGGGFDSIRIRNIDNLNKCFAAKFFDFLLRGFQTFTTAGK